MENDFLAILSSHAPLVALVGTRIYPVAYPQTAASPAIRISNITSSTGVHMQGSDGLTTSLLQVDIRVKRVDGSSPFNTALAIRNLLIGTHGTDGLLHPYRGIKGATDFRLITLSDSRGPVQEKTASEEFYTASLDFNVWSKAA